MSLSTQLSTNWTTAGGGSFTVPPIPHAASETAISMSHARISTGPPDDIEDFPPATANAQVPRPTVPPQSVPKKRKSKRGGRRAGARNWVDLDETILLDIVDKHLPIGAEEWRAVAKDYNIAARQRGRCARNKNSLERRFKRLCNLTLSTSDIDTSKNTQRAKDLQQYIEGKSGVGVISDGPLLDHASENEEEEGSEDEEYNAAVNQSLALILQRLQRREEDNWFVCREQRRKTEFLRKQAHNLEMEIIRLREERFQLQCDVDRHIRRRDRAQQELRMIQFFSAMQEERPAVPFGATRTSAWRRRYLRGSVEEI